ncbi:hypothetical protein Tco_1450399 [Tanacetum coccineum]
MRIVKCRDYKSSPMDWNTLQDLLGFFKLLRIRLGGKSILKLVLEFVSAWILRIFFTGYSVLSTTSDASFDKSKAKGKERKKKIKSLTKSLDNLHSEGLVWKFLASDEFSRVQGELLSLAPSVGFKRGLSMHRTKDEFAVVLKKMVNFMPSAQDRLVEASLLVAQTDYAYLNKIFEHATEPLSIILQLEPEKLARSANVLTPRDTRASPPIANESTLTPISKSLKLSVNVVPASSVVASEWNEEQVYAAVDGSDFEMADSVSQRVSSSHTDVVVALFANGKGVVLIPSSVAGEETVINSSEI